nr:efflux transporter outer membrane subunit [uncultured Holophaga sp.]
MSLALSRGPIILVPLALLLATGCKITPDYRKPTVDTAATFKENHPADDPAMAGGWKTASPADTLPRGKWWEAFGDPVLNGLEERLVIHNQNIRQYFANYMAARALVRNASAAHYPTLSLGPSASRTFAGSGSSSKSGRTYELPLTATWEADLFGAVSEGVKVQSRSAQVSAANLAAIILSEQASLAQYYFELRGQETLQAVYDETLKNDTQALELTRTRFELGIDSQQDVASAEASLRAVEASAVAVKTQRALYEHAIALLVGESAGAFTLPPAAWKPVPVIPPVGLPSQLLERRPDIAAAERTMAAANAQIGVARAAYFPTLTLSASGGTASSAIASLTTWPARFWTLGASLAQTLFDGGARKATVKRYEAVYDADVAAYRQTVLTAFREVEDYLASSRGLAEQTARQEKAVEAAQAYEDIAMERYRTGIDSYLNVLTAQNSLLSSRLTLTQLQVSRMSASVQLIAALGGGWDIRQLPGEAEVGRH